MKSTDWIFPPQWPKDGETALFLTKYGLIYVSQWPRIPLRPRDILAWQLWVEPEPLVKDGFEKFLDSEKIRKFRETFKPYFWPEVESGIKAAWDAALTYASSTTKPIYRWGNYEEWRKHMELPQYVDWANDAWLAARELACPQSLIECPLPPAILPLEAAL